VLSRAMPLSVVASSASTAYFTNELVGYAPAFCGRRSGCFPIHRQDACSSLALLADCAHLPAIKAHI